MKQFFIYCLLFPIIVVAQTNPSINRKPVTPAQSKWYEKINFRGYTQLRFNRLFETNPKLKCEQCDRSWGENGGLFIRRMRIILYGQIHEQVYFYIQPDFASSSGNNLNIGQLRDAYVDIGFDKKNEFRIRLGQSKIPFGFENLQSSQNRLPLDRNDALNSAIANERDVAAILYWAPQRLRQRFSALVNEGFKGEGDYGVVGFGVFNGQNANRPEQNNKLHIVGRVTYPMKLGSQFLDPSIQAYRGTYVVTPDQLSEGTKLNRDRSYIDERLAATFVLYPRPFGIQAEYNIGRGPAFNKETDSIETTNLNGGYATFNYMIKADEQLIYPFIRIQQYNGGKKHELDARMYQVREVEIGVEWQPVKNFELVAQYTISNRRFEDFRLQDNLQKGRLLRLQAQLNF